MSIFSINFALYRNKMKTNFSRILSDNNIETIKSTFPFKYLKNLKRIDLSNNQLREIEEGAFTGASSVLDL